MRDIKFRTYVRFLREMHEVREMIVDKGTVMIDAYQYGLDRDDAPVMQFTGLKDVNGVEIYEGDILKVRSLHYEKDIGLDVVCFEKGCFCLRYEYWSDGLHKWRSIENYDSSDLDVVGNVHQNPDLLRKKQ